MPRPIDADALNVAIEKWFDGVCVYDVSPFEAVNDFQSIVDEQPTISTDDLRGVGRWIRISGFHLDHEYHPARYQCNQCKHFVDSGDDRNYCPNCGAKMEVTSNAMP